MDAPAMVPADGGGSSEVARIRITGSVDRAAVAAASETIHGLISDGVRQLVVDVAGAYDISCRLLTVLARAHERLDTRGAGSLQVVGVVVPQLLPALRDASLDEVFVIYDAVRRETSTTAGAGARQAA